MIEYMTNHPEGTLIYQTDGMQQIKTCLLRTVNQLCLEHLLTYEGYREAIHYMFGVSHRIPIYLCEDMQLLPTGRYRSYETIYINVAAIKTYQPTKNGMIITFISGRLCDIKISLYTFEKQLHLLEKIRDTKVKHFH